MSVVSIPTRPEDITAKWVSDVIGGSYAIGPILRIGEDFGFASELYRVETSGARAERLVVKLWDTSTRAAVRELRFFERFAADCPILVPNFRAGGVDTRAGRAFLVVDELVDVRQGDVTILESRRSLLGLAEALARLHARWWADPELADIPWLVDMQTSTRQPEWFKSRSQMFLDRFGPLSQPMVAKIFHHLAELHAAAGEVIQQATPTLLHGDHHLDNIMFHADNTPVFLDWAGVARGPAVLDLVNLAFRMGGVGDSQAALDTYFATLNQVGIVLDRQAWMVTVNAALLLQFTNWTLGLAAVQMPTDRGSAMMIPSIAQAETALVHWYETHPELLDALALS